MFLRPDITISQTENPINNHCCSGHIAPETFQEKPIRFFKISGNGINGIYCEVCLTVANYIAKQNKKK